MKDFLLFRRMLSPIVIQILFWLGVLVCLFVGVFGLFHQSVMQGLCVLIVGPLVLRVIAEYLIVQFKMNEALQEMRHKNW